MNNYTFTVERQDKYANLVYSIQSTDEIDSLCLGMITNNNIIGLAKTVFIQTDTEKYLKYDVSEKISANQIFKEKVNKKKLIAILSGIVDTIMLTEEYMIDEKLILLDLDYIFVDLMTYDTFLIVLPITNVHRKHYELKTFIKDIVINGTFDYTENLEYIAKIVDFLISNPNFSIIALKKLLNEIMVDGTRNDNNLPTCFQTEKSKEGDMDFGENICSDDETTEITVLLGQEEKIGSFPYLISRENGEKIQINKSIFKIGRKKDYADYCIRKSTVSDKHAYIVKRADGFYIVDTKSKNHTFINGKKIMDNTEFKLEHGALVSFAKEGYIFHMF